MWEDIFNPSTTLDWQGMIQRCSTGHVGTEDSADGSAMLRSTLLVITVALDDTGKAAKIGTVQ